MYLKMPTHGIHQFHNNYDSFHYGEMDITNGVAVFADKDHDHDQRTWRSLSRRMAFVPGVAVDRKTEQQGCI
jgi:hypothetical protein